jgi:hypothetical protein
VSVNHQLATVGQFESGKRILVMAHELLREKIAEKVREHDLKYDRSDDKQWEAGYQRGLEIGLALFPSSIEEFTVEEVLSLGKEDA